MLDWLPEWARARARRIAKVLLAGFAVIAIAGLALVVFPPAATWANGYVILGIAVAGACIVCVSQVMAIILWFKGDRRGDW
jgi:uncharacterized integral membrane protein